MHYNIPHLCSFLQWKYSHHQVSRAHAGPGNVRNNATLFHKNTKRIILGVTPLLVPEHPHLLVSQVPAGPAQKSYIGTTEKACKTHFYLQTLSKELGKSSVIFFLSWGFFFSCLSSKLSIRPHLGSVCLTFHYKLKMLILHHLTFTASTLSWSHLETDNNWTLLKVHIVEGAH